MKKLSKDQRILTVMMNKLARYIGEPYVFIGSIALAVAWFGFSFVMDYDTWYDVIDFFVFMVTFFLLFVNQNSQNADMRAVQDKLDEIIDKLPGADTSKEREEDQLKKGIDTVDSD